MVNPSDHSFRLDLILILIPPSKVAKAKTFKHTNNCSISISIYCVHNSSILAYKIQSLLISYSSSSCFAQCIKNPSLWCIFLTLALIHVAQIERISK